MELEVINKQQSAEEIIREEHKVELGQWYWARINRYDEYDETEDEQLTCITKLGSNYIRIETPHSQGNGYSYYRVHLDKIEDELRFEPNPNLYIDKEIAHYKRRVQFLISEVKEITARLGVGQTLAIEAGNNTPQTNALVAINDQSNVKTYELELVEAKEKKLPALFKDIKLANESLAKWMNAETLPLQALSGSLHGTIALIEDRIFRVSLYAGLSEWVTHCQQGETAPMDTKLVLMQRRLYMDEESLMDYDSGGMDFSSIKVFDEWLCRPKNLNRILPFERCITSFKVRRHRKHRDEKNISDAFVNFSKEMADKTTYLYIRNGENVYRLESDLEFGEMIFPDKNAFDITEPTMAKTHRGSGHISGKMGFGDYQERCKQDEIARPLYEKWKADAKENKDDDTSDYMSNWHNPYKTKLFDDKDSYKLMDQSNVYFDECIQETKDQVNYYNRLVLILQGMFDRTDILHPHPPVQTWREDSFIQNIKLIYDNEALYESAEAPDFMEYFNKLNKLITKDSFVMGQQDFWERKMAERENEIRRNSWRSRDYDCNIEKYRPEGNDGPGFISKITKIIKRERVIFRWMREKKRGWYSTKPIEMMQDSVTVPIEKLFNVSAYTSGDFKQFFNDPRTREKYLKWAPFLLAAEKWHTNNLH